MFTSEDINIIVRAYAECALWSSTGDDGERLDKSHTVWDIEPGSMAQMRADVEDFVGYAARDLSGLPLGQIGHDFWLTRNRHGAGFWDRGLGARGERLTDAAHTFGGSDLYVGDDGKVYVS